MGSGDDLFLEQIRVHYESVWKVKPEAVEWDRGPLHELPGGFQLLRFPPSERRAFWTYATRGLSKVASPERLELHLFSPREEVGLAELLTAVAHYHANGEPLGLGHTVNFGRPWLEASSCDHGLISLPYLDGPKLERMRAGHGPVRFLWLLPITPEELAFKKEKGVDALEAAFEASSFDYLDPRRPSVV